MRCSGYHSRSPVFGDGLMFGYLQKGVKPSPRPVSLLTNKLTFNR